jgi:hypothetical protein
MLQFHWLFWPIFFNDIEEDTTDADRSRLVQMAAPAKETVVAPGPWSGPSSFSTTRLS